MVRPLWELDRWELEICSFTNRLLQDSYLHWLCSTTAAWSLRRLSVSCTVGHRRLEKRTPAFTLSGLNEAVLTLDHLIALNCHMMGNEAMRVQL